MIVLYRACLSSDINLSLAVSKQMLKTTELGQKHFTSNYHVKVMEYKLSIMWVFLTAVSPFSTIDGC